VPRRYWGRYLSTALIVLALLFIASAFARGKIEWPYVAKFLTAQSILAGLVNTIVMSVLAMALGIVLGVVTAVMRLSTNPVLSWAARGYTWLFRGTPVILQLLLWFNLALVFPTIGIHDIWEMRTVDLMTPFLAALLGLGINQGCLHLRGRAGGAAVGRRGPVRSGQGHRHAAPFGAARVILPQAMRVIIPPIGNEFVGMIKLTSLASVIQYAEMLAQRAKHLLRKRACDRAADRGRHLVCGRRHGAVGAAVAHRGLLCPRCGPLRRRGNEHDHELPTTHLATWLATWLATYRARSRRAQDLR